MPLYTETTIDYRGTHGGDVAIRWQEVWSKTTNVGRGRLRQHNKYRQLEQHKDATKQVAEPAQKSNKTTSVEEAYGDNTTFS